MLLVYIHSSTSYKHIHRLSQEHDNFSRKEGTRDEESRGRKKEKKETRGWGSKFNKTTFANIGEKHIH